MSRDTEPDVVDLSKSSTPADAASEEYPDTTDEDTEESVYGEIRDDGDETNKSFGYAEYGLAERFSDKSFSELSDGDVVLIDTPIEGGKTGEVHSVDSTWTGNISAVVDTGASRYEITPYNDRFEEKFIAVIEEERQIEDSMLQSLDKVTVEDVTVGAQVILDVAGVGPVRGMVQEKRQSGYQGHKIMVNAGPTEFTIYEEPSPQQEKEQPYLVGRIQ